MRTRAAPLISAGLVLALLQSSTALAQAGGAEVARGLTAEANLLTSYEDNVFRSTTVSAGQDKADYRLTPSVQARYDLPVARQGFYVDGTVGYNFYLRNESFNRGWWRAGTGVNWKLGSRCSGLADAGYSETQSDFRDLGIALDNVEKHQSYGLNASCAGPAGIGLVAGVDYNKTDNSFIPRREGDLRTISYSGGLLYRSILVGDITLRGVHEKREYPNRFIATPLGLERDGVKVDRASLALTRPIGARLTGSASLSYIWSKPDVSVYEDFKGIGWSADLSYIAGPRLMLGISASRDVTSSAAIDSSYQVTRSYGANASYKLGSRTTLSVGASDTKRSFRGETVNPAFPTLPLRGSEKTRQYHGEVSYAPTERWGISLRYLRDERDSNGSIFDYSGNNVMLNLTVRY